MVAGGEDEHVVLVPGATLNSNVLVDRAQVLHLLVADGDVSKDSKVDNNMVGMFTNRESVSLCLEMRAR